MLAQNCLQEVGEQRQKQWQGLLQTLSSPLPFAEQVLLVWHLLPLLLLLLPPSLQLLWLLCLKLLYLVQFYCLVPDGTVRSYVKWNYY